MFRPRWLVHLYFVMVLRRENLAELQGLLANTCIVLVTLFVTCLAPPLESQQPLVGVIQGTIRDQGGNPIPDVRLSTTNIDSVERESHRRFGASDEHGFYQFVEVPPGHYSLVAKKKGYRDYTVSLVTVYPGQTVQMMDIKMSSAK